MERFGPPLTPEQAAAFFLGPLESPEELDKFAHTLTAAIVSRYGWNISLDEARSHLGVAADRLISKVEQFSRGERADPIYANRGILVSEAIYVFLHDRDAELRKREHERLSGLGNDGPLLRAVPFIRDEEQDLGLDAAKQQFLERLRIELQKVTAEFVSEMGSVLTANQVRALRLAHLPKAMRTALDDATRRHVSDARQRLWNWFRPRLGLPEAKLFGRQRLLDPGEKRVIVNSLLEMVGFYDRMDSAVSGRP